MNREKLKKIAVIGDTGAGKTTLALKIARRLSLPYYSSDSYRFNNGKKLSDKDFLDAVEKIALANEWVWDSAQTISVPMFCPRADIVIYLRFPTRILFYRVLKRALRRLLLGETYDDGRKEDLAHLFEKGGWIRSFYSKLKEKRENYDYFLNKVGVSSIPLVELNHPRDVKIYLERLS